MTHEIDSTSVQLLSTLDYQASDLDFLYQQVFSGHKADTFFLNYEWVVAWLDTLEVKPELFKFFINNKIVGFVFLGHQKSALGTRLFINQTGKDEEDQIWVEYNDIISKNAHDVCRQTLLNHLYSRSGTFKLIIRNATEKSWANDEWTDWSTEDIKAYKTLLNPQNINAHYSKNTKSQLSRAKKHIERHYGSVMLQIIDAENSSKALNDIARLHKQKWESHPLGSGFNNVKFIDFHTALIEKYLNMSVFILKFTAGDLELGYLYYFANDKRVYFYLSAINYADSHNNFKPGLIMHTLAMQHFADQGFSEYDFLAGEARYKTSLSNTEYRFNTIHLFRNKWYYRPIRQMVSVKRWFIKTFLEK